MYIKVLITNNFHIWMCFDHYTLSKYHVAFDTFVVPNHTKIPNYTEHSYTKYRVTQNQLYFLSWYTLHLRSLWPLASVLSKTTLNTGGVDGAGANPQTWKMRPSFLMSLARRMPNLNKPHFIGNCWNLAYEVPRT